MMAELASQRVVLLGPKRNQGVSGVSDLQVSMKLINQANHFIIFQNTPHWNGLNSAFTPHWDEFSLRISSAKQIFPMREIIGNTVLAHLFCLTLLSQYWQIWNRL